MKPDLYLGNVPYYFEYSRVRYTSVEKAADLDDCWEVYSPSEHDFELMEKGKLTIHKDNYPIHKNISLNVVHKILNTLRTKTCYNPCRDIPCGEQCEHCKCLDCWVCISLIEYWEKKC